MKNIKILHLIFVLCLWGISAFSYAEPDPNFHIYLCFGQSNMEGAASVPAAEKQGVSERFKLLFSANDCSGGRKKGQWYTATPPLAHCSSGFGPIDYFGRTLVDQLNESIKVGVVVVAVGGADIKFFESNNAESYVSGEASWFKNLAAGYNNNGYKRLVEMGKLAQKDGIIKGILVHQGETNSGQSNWPNRLKAVYESLLSDLGLKTSEVPLLVGEVRYTGPCSGHNNIIRNVPNVIPTAHVISANGCEAAGDQYHFSVDGYKTLGKRYAEKMLELLGDNPVAQVDIAASAVVNIESAPGEVEISVSKQNENINKIEIYADDKLVATDVNSFVWKDVEEGTHTVYAIGYDSSNKKYTSTKVTVKILPEQKPYNGTPAKIPGKIEAEEFDYGGEGNAYHDNDEQNRNGGDRDEGVDMSNTAIGYTQTGEWVEYTVEVEEDGDYIVESRVASGNSTSQFTLYMDNTFIIPGADGTPGGFIDVPNTGNWSTFTTVKTKLNKLTKGKHILKIEITGDFVDIDYLNFKLASDTSDPNDGNQGEGNQSQGELLTGVTLGQYVDIKVQNRTVSIYAPKGAHTNRPLLISCHGRDQDITYQRNMTKWETVADTADFIVAYPSAIRRGSNVDWDINGTDDTEFIQEVIQKIYQTYKIDLTRVYLSGFSMGGMFTYHCMKTIPNVFAAFAPISGYWDAKVNDSARPLPLIHTHGTSDSVVQFQASGSWAGAENVVKAWAKHNNANEISTYKVESANVTKYSGGDCDADVILAAVPGRDHEPSNSNYHTSREIWRFVSQYSTACGKSKSALKIEVKEIKNNDPGEIEVSVAIVDESVKSVEIFLDKTKVGDGSKTVSLSDLAEGSYTITAIGYDSNNKEVGSAKKNITIFAPQTPFNGTPASIPGKIEAEEFDNGGEGNAYHDNDEENRNGTTRKEGVDMSATAVGYTQTGEWIEYTVNVETTGTYEVEAYVATGSENGSGFTLYMDNELIVAKEISVANTGSWDDFTIVKSSLSSRLTKGEHVLKIEITKDWIDIDYLNFKLVKADETGIVDVANKNVIPNGEYYVYDATGRFINTITISNANEQLNPGFYILKDSEGNAYPMLINK